MVNAAYEERYCAFIDVLGFSQLLYSLDSSSIDFQKVREVLQFTHDSPSLYLTRFISDESDFRYQSISDGGTNTINIHQPLYPAFRIICHSGR